MAPRKVTEHQLPAAAAAVVPFGGGSAAVLDRKARAAPYALASQPGASGVGLITIGLPRSSGEIDATVVIQKWWRNRRHEHDVREAFAWCNLWFQGHCRSCKSYFPTQGEDDVHCPECRDSIKLPNLPPSPIDEIESGSVG